MDDLISRQAAIDVTWKEPIYTDPYNVLTEVRDGIKALPSAQPEKRTENAQKTHACDLIDRQAAIDALDEQIALCDKALSAFDISMKDAHAVKVERASLVAFRETLEYMPSAQPEPKWIPVTDRLPDFPALYLVTCHVYNGRKPVGITTSCTHWHDGKFLMEGVIAWSDLPLPYTED